LSNCFKNAPQGGGRGWKLRNLASSASLVAENAWGSTALDIIIRFLNFFHLEMYFPTLCVGTQVGILLIDSKG